MTSWFGSFHEVRVARERLATEAPSRSEARHRAREFLSSAYRLEADAASLASLRPCAVLHLGGIEVALRELAGDRSMESRSLWSVTGAGLKNSLLPNGHQPGIDDLLQTNPMSWPATEVASRCAVLKSMHENAVELLERDQRLLELSLRNRIVALGAGLLLTAAGVFGLAVLAQEQQAALDLARGKPVRLSSTWAECHPDKNECGGFPTGIAFHTNNELNPWWQVDLGAGAEFSWLSITNRSDMAMWRAIPLVVEVSDDGVSFRPVARQDSVFSEWTPRVGKQTARYLRVRVDRVSTLHLDGIQIHR